MTDTKQDDVNLNADSTEQIDVGPEVGNEIEAADTNVQPTQDSDANSTPADVAPVTAPQTEGDAAMGIPPEEYKSDEYAKMVGTQQDANQSMEEAIGSDITVDDDSEDNKGESYNSDNGLQLDSVSSVLQYEAITAKPAKKIWDNNPKVKEAFLKEYDGDEAKAEQAFIADYTARVDKELHKQKIKRFQIQAEESYAISSGLDQFDDVVTFKPTFVGQTVNKSLDGSMVIISGERTAPTRSVREAEVFDGRQYIDENGKVQYLHKGDTYRDMIGNPAYEENGKVVIAHTYVAADPNSNMPPMLKAVYEGDKLTGEIVSVWDYTHNMMRSNTLNRTGLERIWAPFARTVVNTITDLVSGFTNAGIIIADAVSGEDVGSDLAHKLSRFRVSATDADTGHPMTFNNIADFTVNMAAQILLAWASGGLAEAGMGAAMGVSSAAEIGAAEVSGVGTAMVEGISMAGKSVKTLTEGEKALARALGTGFIYGPMMGYQIREVAIQKGFSTESADMLSLATTVLAGAIFAASDIVPGSSQASYLWRAFTKNGEKQLEGDGIKVGLKGLEFVNNETAIKAGATIVENTEKDARIIAKMKSWGTKFYSKFPKLSKKISDSGFARLHAMNVSDGVRSLWWSAASGAQTMGTVSVMNAALESLWSIPAISNKYDRHGELKPYFWTFEDPEFWKQWKDEFESSVIAGALGGMIGTSITRGWRKVINPYSDDLMGLHEVALRANQGDPKALGALKAMIDTVDKNTKKGVWGSKILSTELDENGQFKTVEESESKLSQADHIKKLFKYEIDTALATTAGYKGTFEEFIKDNPNLYKQIKTNHGILERFKQELTNIHDALTGVDDTLAAKAEHEGGDDILKAVHTTVDEPTAEETIAKQDEKAKKSEESKDTKTETKEPKKEISEEEAQKLEEAERDKQAAKVANIYELVSDRDVIDYNKRLSDKKEAAVEVLVKNAGMSEYNARKYIDSKARLNDILSGKETENILVENFFARSGAVHALAELDPNLVKNLPRLMDKLLAADEAALLNGREQHETIKKLVETVAKKVKAAKTIEDLINLSNDESLLIDGKLPIDPKSSMLREKVMELLTAKHKELIEVVKQNLISKYVLPVLRENGSDTVYYAALGELTRAGNEEAKKLVKKYYKNFKEQVDSRKVTEEDYNKIKAGERVIPAEIPEDYTGNVYEIKLKPEQEFKESGGIDASDKNTSIGKDNILEVLLHSGDESKVVVKRRSIIDTLSELLNEHLADLGGINNGIYEFLGIDKDTFKNSELSRIELLNKIISGVDSSKNPDINAKLEQLRKDWGLAKKRPYINAKVRFDTIKEIGKFGKTLSEALDAITEKINTLDEKINSKQRQLTDRKVKQFTQEELNNLPEYQEIKHLDNLIDNINNIYADAYGFDSSTDSIIETELQEYKKILKSRKTADEKINSIYRDKIDKLTKTASKKEALETLIAITNLNTIKAATEAENVYYITLVDPLLAKAEQNNLTDSNKLHLQYLNSIIDTEISIAPDTNDVDDTTKHIVNLTSKDASVRWLRQTILDTLYPEGGAKALSADINAMNSVLVNTTLKHVTDPFTDIIGMFLRNYEIIDGEVITTNEQLVNSDDLDSMIAKNILSLGDAGKDFMEKLVSLKLMMGGNIAPSESGYEDSYVDILNYAKENFPPSLLGDLIKSISQVEKVDIMTRTQDAKDLTGKILTRMAMVELFTDPHMVQTLASLRELNARVFNNVEFFSPIASDDRLKYSKMISRYIYDPTRMVEYTKREKEGTIGVEQAKALAEMRARQDVLQNVVWKLLHTGSSMANVINIIGKHSELPENKLKSFKSDFKDSLLAVGTGFNSVIKSLDSNDEKHKAIIDNIKTYNEALKDIKVVDDVEDKDLITKLSNLYKDIGDGLYELDDVTKQNIFNKNIDADIKAMMVAKVSDFREDIETVVSKTDKYATFDQTRNQFLVYASAIQKQSADSDVSLFGNSFYKNVVFIEGPQGSGKTVVVGPASVAAQNRLKEEYKLETTPKIIAVGPGERQTSIILKSIKDAGGEVETFDGSIKTTSDLFKLLTNTNVDSDVTKKLKDTSIIVIDEATYIQARTVKEGTETDNGGTTDLEKILNAVAKINNKRTEEEPQLRVILLGSSSQGGYESGMNTLEDGAKATEYSKITNSKSENIGVADIGMIVKGVKLNSQFRYNIEEVRKAASEILIIKNAGDRTTHMMKETTAKTVKTTYGFQQDRKKLGGVRLRTLKDSNNDIWNDEELIRNMENAIEDAKKEGKNFTIGIVYDDSEATVQGLKDSKIKEFALRNEGQVSIIRMSDLEQAAFTNTISSIQGGEFDYVIGETPKGLLPTPTANFDSNLKRWGLLSMLVGRATDYVDLKINDEVPIESSEVGVINRIGAYANKQILTLWKTIYTTWNGSVPVMKSESTGPATSEEASETVPDTNTEITTESKSNIHESWNEVAIAQNINELLTDPPDTWKSIEAKKFDPSSEEKVYNIVINNQNTIRDLLKKDATEDNIGKLKAAIDVLEKINKTFNNLTMTKENDTPTIIMMNADGIFNPTTRQPEDNGANEKLMEKNIVKAYMNSATQKTGVESPERSIKRFMHFTNQLYAASVKEEAVKAVLDDFVNTERKDLNNKYRIHTILHADPVDNKIRPHISIVAENKDSGDKVVIGIIPIESIGTSKISSEVIDKFETLINNYKGVLAKAYGYQDKLAAAIEFSDSNKVHLTAYGAKSDMQSALHEKDAEGNNKRLPGIYVDFSTGGEEGNQLTDIITDLTLGYIHTYEASSKEGVGSKLIKIDRDNVSINNSEAAYLEKVSYGNEQDVVVAYDKDGNQIGPAIVRTKDNIVSIHVVDKVNIKFDTEVSVDAKNINTEATIESLIDSKISSMITKFNDANLDAFITERSTKIAKGDGMVVPLEHFMKNAKGIQFSPVIGVTGGDRAGEVAVLYRYGSRGTGVDISDRTQADKLLQKLLDAPSNSLNTTPVSFYNKREGVGILFLNSPEVTISGLLNLVGSTKDSVTVLTSTITRRVASVHSEARKAIVKVIKNLVLLNKDSISTAADSVDINRFVTAVNSGFGLKDTEVDMDLVGGIPNAKSDSMIKFLKGLVQGTLDANIIAKNSEGIPIFAPADNSIIKSGTYNDTNYSDFDLSQLISYIYNTDGDGAMIAKTLDAAIKNEGTTMRISPIFGSKYSQKGDFLYLPNEEFEIYSPHLLTTADFIARPSLLIAYDNIMHGLAEVLKLAGEHKTDVNLDGDVTTPEPVQEATIESTATKYFTSKVTTKLTEAAEKTLLDKDEISSIPTAIDDIMSNLPKQKATTAIRLLFKVLGVEDTGTRIFKNKLKFSKTDTNLDGRTKSIIKKTIITNSNEYNLLSSSPKSNVTKEDIELFNISNRIQNGMSIDNLSKETRDTIIISDKGVTMKVGEQAIPISSNDKSYLYNSIIRKTEPVIEVGNVIKGSKLTVEAINALRTIKDSNNNSIEVSDKLIQKVNDVFESIAKSDGKNDVSTIKDGLLDIADETEEFMGVYDKLSAMLDTAKC